MTFYLYGLPCIHHYAMPNTWVIPYTSPMIEIRLTRLHTASSLVDHPVVFCAFTTGIKTEAIMTTDRTIAITPLTKFAIVHLHLRRGFKIAEVFIL